MRLKRGDGRMDGIMNTSQPTPPAIEALIAAAGMSSYAAECDIIVVKRTPRVRVPMVIEQEVTPPFAGD